jgi:hypothetical protein
VVVKIVEGLHTIKYDDDSVETDVPSQMIRPARGGGGAGGAQVGDKLSVEAPAHESEAW